MKIIPIAVFLFLANLQLAYCPNNHILTIAVDRPIISMPKLTVSYDALIDVIFTHESTRNTMAYNKEEEAVGGLQIRPCRLKHFNDLTGRNYTLDDMYDFEKAKEVFIYFATHSNSGKLLKQPKSYEQAAKNWNGSGPMTETYWASIQTLLNKQDNY